MTNLSPIKLKEELKFLLSQSGIYGIGTIITQLVGIVMLPVYTRFLSPADYGILELVVITNSFISVIISMGISEAIFRFYYEKEDPDYQKKVISTTLALYAAGALISCVILFNFLGLISRLTIGSEEYAYLFKVAFIYLFVSGLNSIGDTYFRVNRQPVKYVVVTSIRFALLLSFNIYYVAFAKIGVLGILYSTLITNILSFCFVMIPILFKVKMGFEKNLAKDILRFGCPLIPSNLLRILINESDKYFLRYMVSLTDVGILSLALKFGNGILTLLAYPFNAAFSQRRFEIVKREDAKYQFNKIFTYFSFVIIGIGLLLSVFIPEILRLLVTPEFFAAGPLVPVICLYCIVFSFRFHFDFGIMWSKKTMYYTYINFAAGCLILAGNYFFIKLYGLWGVVVSKAVVNAAHTALIYIVARKLYYVDYDFVRVGKFFLLCVAIFFVSMFISTGSVLYNIFFKLGLIAISIPAIVLLKLFNTQEIEEMSRIIKLRRRKLAIPRVNPPVD